MPAHCGDVGSNIGTAILPCSEVFRCALDLPYLTNAHSVRASKFRRIAVTHLALAVIAKLSLSYVGSGPKAGNGSCHGIDGPSWPPSPRLGTGGEPAVNHRLGLSALASTEDRAPIFCTHPKTGVQQARFCSMGGLAQNSRGLNAWVALIENSDFIAERDRL
jgi:hypothetical protein